jgi:hypothetical protein
MLAFAKSNELKSCQYKKDLSSESDCFSAQFSHAHMHCFGGSGFGEQTKNAWAGIKATQTSGDNLELSLHHFLGGMSMRTIRFEAF